MYIRHTSGILHTMVALGSFPKGPNCQGSACSTCTGSAVGLICFARLYSCHFWNYDTLHIISTQLAMLSLRQLSSLGASTSGRPVQPVPLVSAVPASRQLYAQTHSSAVHSLKLHPTRASVPHAAVSSPAEGELDSDSDSELEDVQLLLEPEQELSDTVEDPDERFPTIQFDLPNPVNVKVKTAEYLTSCVKVQDCPPPRYPEFAVIGRSNVGKSSLINMLTGRRELALVSKQPGVHARRPHTRVLGCSMTWCRCVLGHVRCACTRSSQPLLPSFLEGVAWDG